MKLTYNHLSPSDTRRIIENFRPAYVLPMGEGEKTITFPQNLSIGSLKQVTIKKTNGAYRLIFEYVG